MEKTSKTDVISQLFANTDGGEGVRVKMFILRTRTWLFTKYIYVYIWTYLYTYAKIFWLLNQKFNLGISVEPQIDYRFYFIDLDLTRCS